MMVKVIRNEHLISQFILMLFIGIGILLPAYAYSANENNQVGVKAPEVSNKQQNERELVVLIHGLMRTSMSMSLLKSFLENQGYTVYSYSYPSAKYTIHEHSIHLNQYIDHVLAQNPGVKIHFITHSLGGIIVREAIAKLSKDQLKNIGYLIMMAPPNQGSFLAKLSTKMFPIFTSPIKPLAELSSDESSYVHHVPVPKIKMGIIAGRFDAKVPPSSADLDGKADLVVINSTHTFIMNNFKTQKLILNFLEKGTFDDE
ncbi:esterase/lipase family protein [Legionella bononiensis]|uniref:esterase/lipase family protein n=1 Tax=Legionella bononiensis TaxID=2793102 RepID=UPI003F6FE624